MTIEEEAGGPLSWRGLEVVLQSLRPMVVAVSDTSLYVRACLIGQLEDLSLRRNQWMEWTPRAPSSI
jgi:hypothetical protein